MKPRHAWGIVGALAVYGFMAYHMGTKQVPEVLQLVHLGTAGVSGMPMEVIERDFSKAVGTLGPIKKRYTVTCSPTPTGMICSPS